MCRLFNYGIGIHVLQAEDLEKLPKISHINPKDNHISFQVSLPSFFLNFCINGICICVKGSSRYIDRYILHYIHKFYPIYRIQIPCSGSPIYNWYFISSTNLSLHVGNRYDYSLCIERYYKLSCFITLICGVCVFFLIAV